jgi:PIN domain nuclease of toxin-antitoxin system
MKLLIDANVLLWALTENARLSRNATKVLDDPNNELFFSVAGLWELVIKTQIGKLKLPHPAGEFLKQELIDLQIPILSIETRHVIRMERLPMYHRDPFDRVLIAQSMEEDMTIVSSDRIFTRYSAEVIW